MPRPDRRAKATPKPQPETVNTEPKTFRHTTRTETPSPEPAAVDRFYVVFDRRTGRVLNTYVNTPVSLEPSSTGKYAVAVIPCQVPPAAQFPDEMDFDGNALDPKPDSEAMPGPDPERSEGAESPAMERYKAQVADLKKKLDPDSDRAELNDGENTGGNDGN